MRKRKTIKVVAVLITLCLLLTAFSGSAIQAQAEELGIEHQNENVNRSENATSLPCIFRHFYDARTFSGKIGSIPSAMVFTNLVYSSNFPISCASSTAYPVAQDNITSLRHCQADIDTPCNSTQGCGSYSAHHRDIKSISNSLYAWQQRNYGEQREDLGDIVVLWTDYEDGAYCYYYYPDFGGTYQHDSVSYLGCVYDHRPVIHIMDICESTPAKRIPHMSLILAHEFAHCLGAEDEYYGDPPLEHTGGNVFNCVVRTFNETYAVSFYESIMDGATAPFCGPCRASIANGIENWPSVQ